MPPSASLEPSRQSSPSQAQDNNSYHYPQDPWDVDLPPLPPRSRSNSTQEVPPDEVLHEAEVCRERLAALGGMPTRPIEVYSRALQERRVRLMPERPGVTYIWTPDEAYYRFYCARERGWFLHELKCWESFLRWLRRKWVQRNDASGGSIAPLTPVLEMEPLSLRTKYLAYLLVVLKEKRADHPRSWFERGWHFGQYDQFLQHIAGVASQVQAMRAERGLAHEPIFHDSPGLKAQLVIASNELAAEVGSQQDQSAAADMIPQVFRHESASPPASGPSQHNSRRKRRREDDLGQTHSASEPARAISQNELLHAAKKRKHYGSKDDLNLDSNGEPSTAQPPGTNIESTRGKAGVKKHNVQAEGRILRRAKDIKEADPEMNTAQKRRGRPAKTPQPRSALEATAKNKANPVKNRRRSTRKATPLPVQGGGASTKKRDEQRGRKNAVVAEKSTSTKVLSPTGLRRSARVAAQHRNG